MPQGIFTMYLCECGVLHRLSLFTGPSITFWQTNGNWLHTFLFLNMNARKGSADDKRKPKMNTRMKEILFYGLIALAMGFRSMFNYAQDEPQDDYVRFPDERFKSYLVKKFDLNGDGEISYEEAAKIKEIDCSNMKITSLEGIEYCTELTYLNCRMNRLTVLDVSKNTALTDLACYSNPLEVLNLGDVKPKRFYYAISSHRYYPYFYNSLEESMRLKVISSRITELEVSDNQLKFLDVSECPALIKLNCRMNQLAVLDVSQTALCNSSLLHPLDCSRMPTLQTVYLKTGWQINGINQHRTEVCIPKDTQVAYKTETTD